MSAISLPIWSTDDTQERFHELNPKSDEEIEKLTLDEELSEIEKAVILIQSTNNLQRISVIANLPILFERHGSECFDLLRRLVGMTSARTSREQQIVTAASLSSLLSMRVVPPNIAAELVLPFLIKIVKVCNDGVLLGEWSDSLLQAIPSLPENAIFDKVMPFLTSMLDSHNPLALRLLCCQVLAVLANTFITSETAATLPLARIVLDDVLALSQDVDYEMRAGIASQFVSLCRAFGLGISRKVLLAELMNLLVDEAAIVKHNAFISFVCLLEFFDSETREHVLLPYIKKFCREPSEDIILVVAELFGKMLMSISGDLERADLLLLFQFFKGLSTRKLQEMRRMCACNLLAVVQVMGAQLFSSTIVSSYIALAGDSSASVRRCVASSFPQVCQILGPNHSGPIADILLKFLREDIYVLESFVGSLASTVSQFGLNPAASSTYQSHLITALLDCHKRIASVPNWRLHEQFVLQIQDFHKFFTTGQILSSFSPLLLDLMRNNNTVLPVKLAATKSLCHLIRNGIRSLDRRKELCRLLKLDFAKGDSYQHRMLFVDIAVEMARLFSRKFFKEMLWSAALNLSQDKVANVRMKVCLFLPVLKPMIVLPREAFLLKKLNSQIVRLRNDCDIDVAQRASLAADKLNQIDCPVEKHTKAEDVDDRQKQLEEEALFDKEHALEEAIKQKEEEERQEVRRRMAAREAELNMKARIYGRKIPKGQLNRLQLPSDVEKPTDKDNLHALSSKDKLPAISGSSNSTAIKITKGRGRSTVNHVPSTHSNTSAASSHTSLGHHVPGRSFSTGLSQVNPSSRTKMIVRNSGTSSSKAALSASSRSPTVPSMATSPLAGTSSSIELRPLVLSTIPTARAGDPPRKARVFHQSSRTGPR